MTVLSHFFPPASTDDHSPGSPQPLSWVTPPQSQGQVSKVSRTAALTSGPGFRVSPLGARHPHQVSGETAGSSQPGGPVPVQTVRWDGPRGSDRSPGSEPALVQLCSPPALPLTQQPVLQGPRVLGWPSSRGTAQAEGQPDLRDTGAASATTSAAPPPLPVAWPHPRQRL